jgi:hypothetical protein
MTPAREPDQRPEDDPPPVPVNDPPPAENPTKHADGTGDAPALRGAAHFPDGSQS